MYHEIVEEIDDDIRICRAPEEEDYFHVYGEPEGYIDGNGVEIPADDERANIINLIELEGLWLYYTEYRCPCCGGWLTADSIGMVIGDLDPCYREDLLDSAINARKEHTTHANVQ